MELSVVGFGAFKIGRNQGIKYAHGYDLPSEAEVSTLLRRLLDLGINYFDTAPAYGVSEARLGACLGGLRERIVISTKVGETFENGQSRFDFTPRAVQESVARSRLLLQRDTLDLVFVHSHGRDEQSLARGEAVEELLRLKEQGAIRAVGFSGKTPAGAGIALQWADAIMVEFNLNDQTHADVMAQAAAAGKGVIVKKGLASGHLQPGEAIRFVLGNAAVTSMVIGGLNAQHMEANVQAALGTPD